MKTQLSKVIHEGGVLGELLVVLYGTLKTGTQELIKKAPELTRVPTRQFFNKRIPRLKKDFALSEFSGIILTNNEIKDI